MKSLTFPVILSLVALMAPTCVQADLATPFLEDVAEGETGTKRGWLVALDPDGEPASFVILVMSDTLEIIAMEARATKGVVDATMLGKPVLITAKVLKKTPDHYPEWTRVQLKILNVELLEDDD
ncbi:MAG: hypothetical protein HYT88_00865 [Candidatus Omnitrophica bacterium]|nr:hypothetical protein [Candidatus Omnitrophota bacterium]MBI3010637.1 hypothetical protein [Candidatus Omnitrophota bacterium]